MDWIEIARKALPHADKEAVQGLARRLKVRHGGRAVSVQVADGEIEVVQEGETLLQDGMDYLNRS